MLNFSLIVEYQIELFRKSSRKSPKPNRKSLDAEKLNLHPSPKHEPKKMTSHGKKKWNSKTNIKEDVPKFV